MPRSVRPRVSRRAAAAVAIAGLSLAAAVGPGPTAVATVPDDFTVVTVLPDIKRATAFAYAPDGAIFVAEKNGVVRVYDDGVGTIFLNFKDTVNDYGGRGLNAMLLDPNFATNRYVYLFFNEEIHPEDPDQPLPSNGKVMRISGSAADPYVADTSTWLTLLTGYDHQSQAHGVAGMAWDQNGKLLVSFGDGYNTTVDPRHLNAQDLDVMNGKLLRIDPVTGQGVPANPYFSAAAPNSPRSKILARGFRNPWRITIDPVNNNIYVADVGWAAWEELNVVQPSTPNPDRELNFGWPCYEGADSVSVPQPGYAADPLTAPACEQLYEPVDGGTGIGAKAATYAYVHNEPGGENGSAVIAGPIYTGTAFPPSYQGKMFLGDFARGQFKILDPVTGVATPFGAVGDFGSPVDIKQTPSGNIAFLSIVEQQIREIVYTGSNGTPEAVATADVTSGPPPLTVRFTGSASSDPDGDPLSYEWNFGDGTATSSAANIRHVYTEAGSYTATLTVDDGNAGGTDTDTVTIDVGNSAPTVEFTGVPESYRIGDTLPINIVADDAEDGPLSGASIEWDVIVHHLGHIHFEQSGTGTTGSYDVTDHDSDDTFLELQATATDSFGRETTVSELLQPEKVDVTVMSDPSSLTVVVDGQEQTTPYTWASIIGGSHQVSAPDTVTGLSGDRSFDRWASSQLSGSDATFGFTTPERSLELSGSYDPDGDGFAIGDASVVEGDDKIRKLAFTISLPAPQAAAVSVTWTAAGGSAAIPSDVRAATGTVTFQPGAMAATALVAVKGDTRIESDEQFYVTLSNPVGATIADGLAVGRILDDESDAGTSLSVGDVSIVEGDMGRRKLAFTVTLSGPAAGAVSATYATVAGTAMGADFVGATGSVSLTPTQRSKVVTVLIKGDLAAEPGEDFVLQLSDPVGATLWRGAATGHITNDD